MNNTEIMNTVLSLKIGDRIRINNWDLLYMVVCGVSEHFILAHNENKEYTIIAKEPAEYSYRGIFAGDIYCGADWWTLGYPGGYEFDHPAWVDEYMQSLESEETEMSWRSREAVRLLEVLRGADE